MSMTCTIRNLRTEMCVNAYCGRVASLVPCTSERSQHTAAGRSSNLSAALHGSAVLTLFQEDAT